MYYLPICVLLQDGQKEHIKGTGPCLQLWKSNSKSISSHKQLLVSERLKMSVLSSVRSVPLCLQACKRKRNLKKKKKNFKIPPESFWVLRAQTVAWSWGITPRILENRDILQVSGRGAGNNTSRLWQSGFWTIELLFRILEHPVNESQPHTQCSGFFLKKHKKSDFICQCF